MADAPQASGQNAAAGTALEKAFQNPPPDAGLSVVHHWTGGIATKEGITADLENMAATGIDICNWFYSDGNGLQDGVQTWPCKTSEWWDLVDHLLKEAQRVKVAVAPHICSSWGPAGGPALPPSFEK